MAFEPVYFLHGDIDTIIEEKGDIFTAIRKVQWARNKDVEPDKEKAKLEIRKWKVSPEGEIPNKGLTFMTDEGPNNCVTGLINLGYGDTREILLAIKDRQDFRKSVETLYDDSEASTSDGEFFDARELLLNE